MDMCICYKTTKTSLGMMNNKFIIVILSGERGKGVRSGKGTQVASVVSSMFCFLGSIFLRQIQQNVKICSI